MRAMVTAWWVMIRKRVSVRPTISSRRSQKRVTLASSSGASTSSRTQIGEGLARKTAKMRLRRGQGLLAAGEEREGRELLAGRLAHDLEAGFQRVVALDQHEAGLAAAEEVAEEGGEVAVDLVEGGEQAAAALAVQVGDALAELADRLLEVVALAGQGFGFLADLAGVLLGAEVDGAEAVAGAAEAVDLGFQRRRPRARRRRPVAWAARRSAGVASVSA